MRPILATLDLAAFRHNLNVAKAAAPHSKVMAVIKANGYGHGVLIVASGLKDADGFAVLGLDEALKLRQAGYQQTILLLEGVFSAEELKLAANNQVSIVVHHDNQIAMLEQAALSHRVHVFAKMNTGMNRLGFTPEGYRVSLQRLQSCVNVASITMMTHFATADEAPGIALALALFNEYTKGLNYPKSLANSAATLRHPEAHADWVRPGIMIYGASPVTGQPASDFGLKPAMTLTSEIISVQTLKAGNSVGYGQRFTASKPTRVGIVACGYADGYPRHAPNGTPVAVDGQLTQTLGRVSMDMLFADLTDIPNANVGSAVELWGNQVSVDAVAEASGTVGYELLCAVTARVPVKVIN